ncbi:MAG: hypothetical protein ACRD2C_20685 [Acidimicrobiales bacterium]
MTGALAVVGVAVVLGTLALVGRRLWVIDRDLTSLDKDFMRFQDELRATYQRHAHKLETDLQQVEATTTVVRGRLEWIESWVRYWAASQEGGR